MLADDVQNMAYRGPEVYLGHSCTSSLDIWSLGCLVSDPSLHTYPSSCQSLRPRCELRQTYYMVTGGADLFQPCWRGIGTEDGFEWDVEEQQLVNMIDVLEEEIPIGMRARSQYWDRYLDEEGQLRTFKLSTISIKRAS